jgi:glycosyltransferase involved in cell wall biosynthesis
VSAPLISFLIAVRNRPDQVCAAIRSVPLERDEIEVIVVDDASTDETPKRIEAEFAGRVRLFRQHEHRGSGAARNLAARSAQGTWAFILDSDNQLLPDAVDKVSAALAATPESIGLLFMNSLARSTGTPTGAKTVPEGLVDYRDLLRRRVRGEYIPVVRVDALVQMPYDEIIGRECSGILWFRIAKTHGAAVYDEPVLVYDDVSVDRMTDPSQSLKHPVAAAWCHRRMLEVFGSELRNLDPEVWADHVARGAFWRMVGGDRSGALREVSRAVRASRNPSVMKAAAAIVAGPRLARRIYAG